MLVEIDNKLISTEIFERKFVCDLSACKGACCVEGDAGAPLTVEEVGILEDNFDVIKPYMRKEGIEAVEEKGVFYMDWDNDPVTTLVNGKECAFVYFNDAGIAKCSIEKAHREGKLDFKKPLSCHLYPIRVGRLKNSLALNFSEWSICAPATTCGIKLEVPVFRFLKEPLTRAFGATFFEELCLVEAELNKGSIPDVD